jgi:hypothetical protein
MTGTVFNAAAIVIGSLVGRILGNRLPDRGRETVLDGFGLMVLVVGASMALQSQNILIPMFSVLVGGVIGELLRIEERLQEVGAWLERRTGRYLARGGRGSVVRAFVV